MAGVFSGLRVLDLSWGIAGPMTAMLMGDHGAETIKVEPPCGDPFQNHLGYKVWQRGKRSAILDLKDEADRESFLMLARHADVLIESFSPGTTERLGIDYATLSELNPALVYTSITAYGRDTVHAHRPGYDALVAARVGLQWEQRGWPEGAVNHMHRRPDPFPDLDVPYDWVQGPPRKGPVFSASHWPSLGACFAASVGISAALRARGITGRGQLVETSLMQGALASTWGVWQRAENPDVPGYDTWVLCQKSPKGHFECADGRWVHNWVPNPRFIMVSSEGDTLNATPDLTVQKDPDRFGAGAEELLVMNHYQPILAERVKKFPCDAWVEAAAIAGMTMQEVRPVEQALADPLMLADGCVIELNDPELGPIRQVGITYSMTASPGKVQGPAPKPGEHTEHVKAEAAEFAQKPSRKLSTSGGVLKRPLEGIRVLDLGLAIAGPFGTQILSDFGADVIKINALWDQYFHRNHIGMVPSRGKRSIALMLKHPKAKQVLIDLVRSADIVQTNMRYEAVERLGFDYESLRKIKPDLIYCHSRGHEHGPRETLPGNDQTGACLAGVQYEDGAMQAGGKPFWSFTSFGDTGNGFLTAIALIQALYHRDHSGEGQFVDTAIVNAHLLNTSYAIAKPDGTGFDRPRLDRMQLGFNAGCRLYETAKGWICVVASTQPHWDGLFAVLGLSALIKRYPGGEEWKANDAAIAEMFEKAFKTKTAETWGMLLDEAGVPAEISSETFSLGVMDDKDMRTRGWTVGYPHPEVGYLEQIGLVVSLSETPGKVQGPPLMVGDNSELLLRELGRTQEEIDALIAEGVVGVWPLRQGQKELNVRMESISSRGKRS